MTRKQVISGVLTILALCLAVAAVPAQNPNPVLPGVADAGVVKYNGKYYIGGVRTDGDFYHSSDLVNWEGPTHVLDMDNEWTKGTGAGNNQIHANHMIYIDGVFHLYWSVNHWGDDKHIVHVAHAESEDILGPYVEPQKDTWMDNRIDPMVFRDDDGKLYMYMVRFTDGNTIWARPMADARTFDGPVIYQYASLPGTWERMDNRVIEGPWVIKYRDRYYMMFNGNHTGTAWGNYQLGVAEASSPVTFNNGTKYPYPLLLSNQTPLEEEYANLLIFKGSDYEPLFSYTTEEPSGKWYSAGYDDSSWAKGRAAFSSAFIEGSTVRRQGTKWDAPGIYVRKDFSVTEKGTGNLALRVHHDAPVKVWLNGEVIYESDVPDYLMVNLTARQRALLRDGENILAAESTHGRRGGFLDLALFDLRETVADDILYSPGQPNIVRGLNGFEWWLVYMANKNREQRSQYVNRIHFFDKTMYAEGVTSTATKGYFPVPSKPTFGDVFDNADKLGAWNLHGGEWSVSDGEMHSPARPSTALLEGAPGASHYLFEAGVNSTSEAGIIVWQKGSSDRLSVGLDPGKGMWYTELALNGKASVEHYPLTPGFRFGVYHTITAELNGDRLSVRIDDLNRTPEPLVIAGLSGDGVPGLFSAGKAAFDGVAYTIGWDEFDGGIAGWGNGRGGEKATGEYAITGRGLEVASDAPFRAFKGDALAEYEYSLQVSAHTDRGTAGMYAVWIDKDNHVSIGINYALGRIETKVVKDGRTVAQNHYPLGVLRTLYADMRFTDSMEKGYTFDSPAWIESLWLDRIATDIDFHGTIPEESNYNTARFMDNAFDKFTVEYSSGGKWFPLTGVKTGVAPNPAYSRMTFAPVKAEALRFINRNPRDQQAWIYKIRAGERSKESYNIRSVRKNGQIIVLVDGREICRLEDTGSQAAQVGIFSEGCTPRYNGILRYDISPGDAAYDNVAGIVPDCADPYVLQHEGKYYLYGTGGRKGIRAYVSDDLANWSAPVGASDGFALDSTDVWGSHGFWAPEVYKIGDKFRMYFTVEERIAMAESDSPLGPFVQRKEGFRPFHPDIPEIDTHVFTDEDGRRYLYFVRFTGGNEIWVAELADDLRSIKEETLTYCFGSSQGWEDSAREPYPHARVNEGPFILKHKGLYYLTYSANHTANPDYGVGYATSTSPMGPWTKYEGNPVLTGNGKTINGPGHHSFTRSPSGQLYIVYHTHFDMTRMGPRKLAIDPAGFEPSPNGGPDILRIYGPSSTPQKVR